MLPHRKWVLLCCFHVLSFGFICNTLCFLIGPPPVTSILIVFMSFLFHWHHSLLPLPSFFSGSLYCLDVAHRSVWCVCIHSYMCVCKCVYIYICTHELKSRLNMWEKECNCLCKSDLLCFTWLLDHSFSWRYHDFIFI